MLQVHRADDRFRTTAPGLDSRHSFSFGPHHDPDNLGFGPLLVSNEDRLEAGAGFDRHAHRGVDIVTWVLGGTLEHEDSTGRRHQLTAGSAQRLRAGSGVHHAEHAAVSGERTGAHYVQMWLRSAAPDAPPDYAWADFGTRLDADGSSRLVTVATGDRTQGDPTQGDPTQGDPTQGDPTQGDPTQEAALTLDQPGAEFSVARLPAGTEADVPVAALVHVFVARGTIHLDGNELVAGDAARISGADHIAITADADAEILVWRLAS